MCVFLPYNRNMSENLPIERETARLTAPDWYDFHYSRRLKRVVTPMSLLGALLIAFGIFIILTCLYVAVVAAVVADAGIAVLSGVAVIEVGIIAVAVWALVRDYESRRKERRLTPYGRKFNDWLDTDFIPWIRSELAIYMEQDDAEELIIRKVFTHISFRGTSTVRVSYEGNDIVINRDVLRAPGLSSILDEQMSAEMN